MKLNRYIAMGLIAVGIVIGLTIMTVIYVQENESLTVSGRIFWDNEPIGWQGDEDVAADGIPLELQKVVYSECDQGICGDYVTVDSATTDERGAFSFKNVKEEEYSVVAPSWITISGGEYYFNASLFAPNASIILSPILIQPQTPPGNEKGG